MVIVAYRYWSQPVEQDYLCLCTPATKEKPFLELPGPLSIGGRARSSGPTSRWASRAYCESATCALGTPSWSSLPCPVGTRFALGRRMNSRWCRRCAGRTMGCTEGGSIKFVCIDRSRGHLGKAMVKMWTLDLARKKWKAELGVLWNELWNQLGQLHGGRDVGCGAPVSIPCRCRMVPSASCCTAQGGWELITSAALTWGSIVHIPLWHGRFPDHHAMGRNILPDNLFTKCSPPPLESNLPARKRKLASIDRQKPKLCPCTC